MRLLPPARPASILALVVAAGLTLAAACSPAPRIRPLPLAPSVASPASPAGPGGLPLPTESCGRYFIAEVEIDGGGPFRMVLDTGAPRTVLDPEAARAAGIDGFARSMRAGPFRVEGRIPVLVREMSHLGQALRSEVDGILGYDVFEGKLLTYDYPAGEVRVAEGRLPPHGPGIAPLSRSRRPRVGARLGERKLNLLVDTGFSGGLALEDFDTLAFAEGPVPVGARVRIDGLHLRRAGRLARDLVLGAFVIEAPVAVDAVGDALLGQELLGEMIVTLDRASGLARFLRPDGSEPGALRMPSHFGTGVALRPGAERYEVVRVFPETPAAREGIREGDAIVAIDGVRIADRGCADPDRDPRAPRRLTFLRDGVEMEVELVPAALVP